MNAETQNHLPGWTIYSRAQGCGYIHEDPKLIEGFIRPVPVTVVDEFVQPGSLTTLSGYLAVPVRYLGLNGDKEMIFFIGSAEDLFEPRFYYLSIYLVHRYRIFEMFSFQSGRDHNWINGRWK